MLYAYFWAGNAVSYVIISPRASPLGSVWWFFGVLEDWRLQMKYYSEKNRSTKQAETMWNKRLLTSEPYFYNHESSITTADSTCLRASIYRLYHWTWYWKMKRASYCLDLDYRFLKQKVRACFTTDKQNNACCSRAFKQSFLILQLF